MIFEALVIPNFRSLDHCNQHDISPVFLCYSASSNFLENSSDIDKCNNRDLFLHLSSHHDKLNKILNVWLLWSQSIERISKFIIKAVKILYHRFHVGRTWKIIIFASGLIWEYLWRWISMHSFLHELGLGLAGFLHFSEGIFNSLLILCFTFFWFLLHH